ncbi:chemotaxis protein CheA [Thermochromatium tepidum]|uniref:Chemotaxis protein CheA n=1 Tax=Thermochromatium tepidum ATCC 43061 TaxID=316276 RepID=A0A6I6ELE6_THETI|nr:chemotaxis protein CheA [Thermochromatium tepidum]QGU33867.1 chemotaxis protein CheA [Thermochromatium tepidum ATCC 43061]
MNPLLEQFIQEARDFLQTIGEKLIQLEDAPDSVELVTELFRAVHTLKGNSGLFEFPEMTRVLHAGEDLMDAVRDGRVAYSQELADRLLEAMDFVSLLLDEIEAGGQTDPAHAAEAETLARSLRELVPAVAEDGEVAEEEDAPVCDPAAIPLPALAEIPEAARMSAFRAASGEATPFLIAYRPEEECFFKGEDPLFQARNLPGLVWGRPQANAPWPPLAEMDCYRSVLDYHLLAVAPRAEIDEYFRYTPDQVHIAPLPPFALVIPQGHPNGGPVYGDFVAEAIDLIDKNDLAGLEAAASTLLELSSPELWLSSALRWLLALIETCPQEREVLRRLVRSLETLTPPELADVAAEGATAGAALAAMGAAESAANAVIAPEGAPTTGPGYPVGAASAAMGAIEPATGVVIAPEGAPKKATPLTDDERARVMEILAVQAEILALPDGVKWLPGRLKACAATLSACLANLGESGEEVEERLAEALAADTSRPLAEWLAAFLDGFADTAPTEEMSAPQAAVQEAAKPAVPPAPTFETKAAPPGPSATAPAPAEDRRAPRAEPAEGEAKFGRRAEDAQAGKILKVDQAKVDRLMNLIGEMVVAKNGLPYLANRAENQYGVRELSREIKSHYAVINRIAEEMQDAIMQVRMMPLSFVFQRFPRLVRDISRKLGKEVELVLEGEDTEADKNIVEALADPLIHIVRNSLDHGIELPEVRRAAGKPAAGRLLIRATQESDRAVIEISDDGKGIDPAVIKRKAYEKGLIDEARLERITDQEAINLVFAPGFSTAETVSDLSGRGVGMDVVRSAIDKVGGTVELKSIVGRGTTVKLSLPLSMAVTNVMIIESDRQVFGVPMDQVVETVRVPHSAVRTVKQQKTTVLRERIVPLVALNDLLAIPAAPRLNTEDELAVLVVKVGSEQVGLLVDEFREVVDVILKPLPGELAKLAQYAGTALLGDGTVLMVLNPKELF